MVTAHGDQCMRRLNFDIRFFLTRV